MPPIFRCGGYKNTIDKKSKANSVEYGFRFMVNGRKLVLALELVKIELPPLYHQIISSRRLENQSTQESVFPPEQNVLFFSFLCV